MTEETTELKFPNRLKELRLSRQLTQDEVAAVLVGKHGLEATGVAVSVHESGRRKLPIDVAIAYAQLYKVESIELIYDMYRAREKVADETVELIDTTLLPPIKAHEH